MFVIARDRGLSVRDLLLKILDCNLFNYEHFNATLCWNLYLPITPGEQWDLIGMSLYSMRPS